MNVSAARRLRMAAALAAIGCLVASHITLALGQGYGAALTLAAVQALATGAFLWSSLPVHRWAGPVASTVLLAALAAGAVQSPETGLLAVAGTAHALLYSGLLLLFSSTLRPGRVALATTLASRLNPTFHPGMIPYTRGVTWAWALFFAAQLLASAILLATVPARWPVFVTILNLPLVLLMAVAEAAIRRWRWRHEHPTSFIDTIRGVRRLMAQRADKSAIAP